MAASNEHLKPLEANVACSSTLSGLQHQQQLGEPNAAAAAASADSAETRIFIVSNEAAAAPTPQRKHRP